MKRIITLFIIGGMLSTLFSACGNEPVASTSSAGVANEVIQEEIALDSAENVTTEEDIAQSDVETSVGAEDAQNLAAAIFPNSDTAELKFSNIYELPLSDEGETLTMMRSAVSIHGPLESAGINSFDEMDYIHEIEARTNVSLDITEVTHETQAQAFQLAIASGDFADMLCGFNYATGTEGALNDEVIIDLTDDLEEYSPNYSYMIHSNPEKESEFLSDGKVLKYMSPYDQYAANQGMVIRQDWLDELDLEIPQTYDALTDVLTAFKNRYDCSSAIYMNQECYINMLSDGYDICAFYADGGNRTAMPYYVDNGVVKCSLNEDGYREYLKMMNNWYNAGLIDSDFISVVYDPFSSYLSDQIASDQMGVWCTSGEGVDNYSDISCLPSPTKDADGMNHVFSTSLVSDSNNDTYISTCCENVELAMRWMDYWYSQDGILFANYGIEGESYTIGTDKTPQFTESVINNEYGVTVSNMMRLHCGYGVFSAPMIRYRTASFNSDIADEAWEVWTSKLDGSMTMPEYVSLSAEQSEAESTYTADLLTYAEQMIPQFIIGDADIDSEWDEYCNALSNMGIDKCVEVWQEAYDTTLE